MNILLEKGLLLIVNMIQREKNIFILSRKKLIIILLICLNFILRGYTFPENQPYLLVSDNFGANTKLYFAKNMVEYVNIVGNNVISNYSSTLYGYTRDYRISFGTYSDQPTYSSGYNSYNYNISLIKENHLYDDDAFNLESHKTIILVSLISGVLLCLLVSLVKS